MLVNEYFGNLTSICFENYILKLFRLIWDIIDDVIENIFQNLIIICYLYLPKSNPSSLSREMVTDKVSDRQTRWSMVVSFLSGSLRLPWRLVWNNAEKCWLKGLWWSWAGQSPTHWILWYTETLITKRRNWNEAGMEATSFGRASMTQGRQSRKESTLSSITKDELKYRNVECKNDVRRR